jgi:hypothetical protein
MLRNVETNMAKGQSRSEKGSDISVPNVPFLSDPDVLSFYIEVVLSF